MWRGFEHVGRRRINAGDDQRDGGANDGVGGGQRDAEFYRDCEQR